MNKNQMKVIETENAKEKKNKLKKKIVKRLY